MKTNNQAFIDLMETIQREDVKPNRSEKKQGLRLSINDLQVKKGYHCKLNDILFFCQKIENGETLDPIEVNQNNMIVDGVKRYFAYKRLKFNFVHVKGRGVFVEEFIGEGFKIIW